MRSESSLSNEPSAEPTRSRYEAARLALLRLHVREATGFREVFRDAARIVSDALRVERVGVWMFDDAHCVIRCDHLYERASREVFEGALLRVQDFPAYFRALDEKRAVPADDARRDPATHELGPAYLEPLGILSMLDAPIYRDGRLAGVVCCEDVTSVRNWTRADCDFAATISDTFARLFAEHDGLHAQRSIDQLELRLMQSQRMEAVGRVSAGLAHDFQTILFAISGFSQLLLESPDARGEVTEFAQRISDAAARGRALCDAIASFSRDQVGTPVILDLSKSLANLAGLLRGVIDPATSLQIEVPPGISRVFVDPTQLERALINLVTNARDARPRSIAIRLFERAIVEGDGATYVVLEVIDDGCGMDDATRARMFDPFFTTKAEGGVGLGASIVQQVVTHAGGFIQVESAPGVGTRVRLFLPRIARAR